MCKAGMKPNEVSYSSVINAWAQKSEVKQAEQWLDWMCKADMKPELISDNSVINAWAHVSDIRRSVNLHDRLECKPA